MAIRKMRKDSPQIIEAKRNAKRVILLSMVIVIPVMIYFIFFDLGDDHNVSGHGYAAHILGVVLAFVSAFLFMGMTFFSARGGYDEQPNYREMVEQQREANGQE